MQPSQTSGSALNISINVQLDYKLREPCEMLLQIEAASTDDQQIQSESLNFSSGQLIRRTVGEENIGTRLWVQGQKKLECEYTASVVTTRPHVSLEKLRASPLPSLDADILKYLMPSRYCHPEAFFEFTANEFSTLEGGALITAMCGWIAENISYDPGASNVTTTAYDTLISKRGVCRDYTHVLIALARACSIPARAVSAFAPDATPPDFHAVAEIYLDDGWHLVDATGMSSGQDIVRIGVGRDAADISFLAAFGNIELRSQSVNVVRRTPI